MKKEYINCKGSTIIEHHNNRCVFCGTKTRSSDINICDECLSKYKNRELLVKVGETRSTIEVKNVSEKYNEFNVFRCIDGHKVKSEQEVDVDNYLYNHRIVHSYELEINEKLHPDFYIPEYDVYIEYWSSANIPDYFEEAAFKLIEYAKKKLTVIGLYRDDLINQVNIEEIIKNAVPNKLNRCTNVYELLKKYTLYDEIRELEDLKTKKVLID